MDNGFPWKRFLEGFFVVAMLLFLDPAIYWSILLPCAIHHGGYKHELLSVQYVDFGRRQGGLHAAGSIQFAEACGTLLGDEGRRKEKVALPIGSGKSSCGKTVPVWVNRAYYGGPQNGGTGHLQWHSPSADPCGYRPQEGGGQPAVGRHGNAPPL